MTINSGNDTKSESGDKHTKTTLQVTMSTDAGLQIVTTTTPVSSPVSPIKEDEEEDEEEEEGEEKEKEGEEKKIKVDLTDTITPITSTIQKISSIEHLSHQQTQKHQINQQQQPIEQKIICRPLHILPNLSAAPISPVTKTPTSPNCKMVGFTDHTQQFCLPVVDNCIESPVNEDWKAALARDITEYGRQFNREIARHSSSCTSASSSRPESRTSGCTGGGQLSRASTSASSHSHASNSGNHLRAMRKSPTQCSSGGDSAEERGRRSVSPPIRELLAKPKIRSARNADVSSNIGYSSPIRPNRLPTQVSSTNDHTVIVSKATLTMYEKLRHAMQNDRNWAKEVAFGRRIGMYRFRGDVGNGNFSTVKFATHSLIKEKVAIKILDKTKLDAKTQRMLTREIRTMETIHHPHLIRIFEVIETLTKHYLIMELAPGGELFQVISQQGRFAETEAKFYFAQIVSAINHMHQHNLIHRDIKAENVFFSDPYTIKVGDFGFSTRISCRDELLSTFCGSPPYAAPELFRDESYRGPFVDYWALGVLLHFMVTGQMPFRAQTIVALKRLILECHYDIPIYVSFECCQLIAGFLQKDPTKRYTLEQARSTRWLRNQLQTRSAPKYDLKISFAKLIHERRIAVELKRHNSVNELFLTTANTTGDNLCNKNSNNLDSFVGEDSIQKRNNRMSLIETKSFSLSPTNESKSIVKAICDDTTIKLTKKQQLSEVERKCFRQLLALGIDSNVIAENLDRGSLSPIAGTFRILMHRNLYEINKNSSRSNGRMTCVKGLDRTKSLPDDGQFWNKYVQNQVQTFTKKDSKIKPNQRLPFVSKIKTFENKESTKPLKLIKQSNQESKRKCLTLTPTTTTTTTTTASSSSSSSATATAAATIAGIIGTATGTITTTSPLEFDVVELSKVKNVKEVSLKSNKKNSGISLSRSWKTMNNLSIVNPNPVPTIRDTGGPSDTNNNQVCIDIGPTVTTSVVQPRQIVHETTMMQISPTVNQSSGCSAGFGWPTFAKQLKRSQTTPNVSTCHKTPTSTRLTLPNEDGKNRCTIF